MDAKRFDLLAKTVSANGTRRGLVRLLTILPLSGWLAVFSGERESVAKRRKDRDNKREKVGADNHKHEHRRRKHNLRHRHGHKDKNKKNKHKDDECQPQSAAQTCDEQCGTVQNNCQQAVDCGPCNCDPPCPACQVCNAESGQCEADPDLDGESCGACRTCGESGDCDECAVCCGETCCSDDAVCHAADDTCCEPESTAETCDGECGPTDNNCGIAVACGPCTCPVPCPDCQTCNTETGACVADPTQAGQSCGDPWVCAEDGSCACEGSVCGHCNNCGPRPGTCQPDPRIVCTALDQCHDAGVCDPENGLCTNPVLPTGTPCDGGVCQAGNCVACGGAVDDVCCRDVANELFCYGTLECAFFGQCVESCGGLNEFCCPNATCDGSMVCAFFGECIESCGRENEFCCHNAEQGYFCDAALECSYFTECIAECGGDGEFCCLQGACDEGFTCDVEARCRPNG